MHIRGIQVSQELVVRSNIYRQSYILPRIDSSISATMSAQPMSTVPTNLSVVGISEKVTGRPALRLIQQSGILKAEPNEIVVLDNATGGGVLLSKLLGSLEMGSTTKIQELVAGDIDDTMVDCTQKRASKEHWESKAAQVIVQKIDQHSIPFSDATFSHVFNNMGIFFSRDDALCLREVHRVLKPGGTAHFATWQLIPWWKDIAVPVLSQHFPDAPPLPPPGSLFATSGWNDTVAIRGKLESTGFEKVIVEEYAFKLDVPVEEFAEACAVLINSVAKRVWSAELYEAVSPKVGQAFLDQLKKTHPEGIYDGDMTAIVSGGWKN